MGIYDRIKNWIAESKKDKPVVDLSHRSRRLPEPKRQAVTQAPIDAKLENKIRQQSQQAKGHINSVESVKELPQSPPLHQSPKPKQESSGGYTRNLPPRNPGDDKQKRRGRSL